MVRTSLRLDKLFLVNHGASLVLVDFNRAAVEVVIDQGKSNFFELADADITEAVEQVKQLKKEELHLNNATTGGSPSKIKLDPHLQDRDERHLFNAEVVRLDKA